MARVKFRRRETGSLCVKRDEMTRWGETDGRTGGGGGGESVRIKPTQILRVYISCIHERHMPDPVIYVDEGDEERRRRLLLSVLSGRVRRVWRFLAVGRRKVLTTGGNVIWIVRAGRVITEAGSSGLPAKRYC